MKQKLIDFSNTAIAFETKSNFELKRSYWIFWFFGFPKILKFAQKMLFLSLKLRLPIEPIIRFTVFKQFCGGENIMDCQKTLVNMQKARVGAILDYSVEGQATEKFFNETVAEILATLDQAKKDPTAIPFSVFKVTGITRFALLENKVTGKMTEQEQKDWEKLLIRVDTICKKAHEVGVPILIDAEESWIQDSIDELVHQMMLKYNNEKAIVYNTIQLYRHDRLAFLKKQVTIAQEKKYFYGVKLVRGAYMEKERLRAAELNYPSPIQKDKAATDADFDATLAFCLDHIEQMAICAGSHNENSNLLLAQLMKEKGIAKNDKRIYFAQLFGMSDHISYNLAHEGYNVAKYLPYGPLKETIPYLVRRSDENTSIGGQMGRELLLLTQEIARRKNKK